MKANPRTKTAKTLFAAAAALALASAALPTHTAHADHPQYTLTPIGVSFSVQESQEDGWYFQDLNNNGVVLIGSSPSQTSNGFGVRATDGTITWSGLPDGSNSVFGNRINDSGLVVGRSDQPSVSKVVQWRQESGFNTIEAPAGWSNLDSGVTLIAVNNANQVAGHVAALDSDPAQYLSWIYDNASGVRLTDNEAPFVEWAQVVSINDSGQMAGAAVTNEGSGQNIEAAFWSSENELQVLGRADSEDSFAQLYDVNNNQEAIGWSGFKGVYWSEATGFIKTEAEIFSDINDDGVAVGLMPTGPAEGAFSTAAVWSMEDGLSTLDELLTLEYQDWQTNSTTIRINNDGVILASAISPDDGLTYAVLLTPVPEPGSFALVALSSLCLLRRRHQDVRA